MALSDNNTPGNGEDGEATEGPVIRDNRRIDPETYQAREPKTEDKDGGETAESTGGDAEENLDVPDTPEDLLSEAINADERVVELTNDLKRVQAEYSNYRKRVERDRQAVQEASVAKVVGEFLPILDDIGRAREHEELTGGFKAVGEALEAVVTKLGLEKYGEKGDEFDPTVHEALTLVPAPNISVQTVIEVFQPGYRIDERILRPARVVVGDPAEETEEPSGDEGTSEETGGETDNKK